MAGAGAPRRRYRHRSPARRRLRLRDAGLAGLGLRRLAAQRAGGRALPALHQRPGGRVLPHRPPGPRAPRGPRLSDGACVRTRDAGAARRPAGVRELLRSGRTARLARRAAGAARGHPLRLRRRLDFRRLRAAPTVTAPPPSQSIAVLPFANLSGEPDKDYFSDGLAEGVAHALAPLRALRIAAHASGLAFKGGTLEPREIAKRLGVETVLEGGVRRAGEELQVTVRLVGVADGTERWAARYDRALTDVFAVLAEIATHVAGALGVSPTDTEQGALARPPTTDVPAYDSYLQGRQLAHQLLRRSQESARMLFEQAIAQDATFARAHAGLATSHAMMFQYWDSSQANVQAADGASARAVELGPDLADAHGAP